MSGEFCSTCEEVFTKDNPSQGGDCFNCMIWEYSDPECMMKLIVSLQAQFKKSQEENKALKECVNLYADKTRWQYSSYNSIYKNWIRAHPSDQEKLDNMKWVGGKIARLLKIKLGF